MWTLLLLPAAWAQDDAQTYGFDAHGFRFVSAAADPRAPLRFVRPGAAAPLGWSAGAVAEYAPLPLRFASEDGTRFSASSQLAAVNVAGGFSPVAGLAFDVSAPVVLTNTWGGAPDPSRAYPTVVGGPTLADLRVSVLAAPLRPGIGSNVGLGLLAALDVPTGAPERWLGTPGPAALIAAVATLEGGALTWSGQVGARLAPNTLPDARPAPTLGGDTAELAGAVSWLVRDGLGLGVEATAAVPIDPAVRAALSIPAEATLVSRYQSDGGRYLAAGVGVGLGAGAGASPVRVVLGGGWGTPVAATPRDRDRDGLPDRVDACPTEPEAPNQLRDDDGCPDVLPRTVVEARSAGVPAPGATLTATLADGSVVTGVGTLTLEGLPGAEVAVRATDGACRAAAAVLTLPADGESLSPLSLTRAEATVVVRVVDATGQTVEGARVRYVVEDEFCRPADASLRGGRGTHVLGTGPVKLFVTALGYEVRQVDLSLAATERRLVEVDLAPTGVQIEEGRLKMSVVPQFEPGSAALDASGVVALQQVAAFLRRQDPVPSLLVAAWAEGRDAEALSRQRAEAVVTQLVAFGVPPARLSATGEGAPPPDRQVAVELRLAR
jgi:hypothetical protein